MMPPRARTIHMQPHALFSMGTAFIAFLGLSGLTSAIVGGSHWPWPVMAGVAVPVLRTWLCHRQRMYVTRAIDAG